MRRMAGNRLKEQRVEEIIKVICVVAVVLECVFLDACMHLLTCMFKCVYLH